MEGGTLGGVFDVLTFAGKPRRQGVPLTSLSALLFENSDAF